VLHWHGETFELPPGARLLAPARPADTRPSSSASCDRAAVPPRDDRRSLRAIIDNCRAELVPARWIQDEAAILGHAEGHFAATHALMDRLLGWLTRR
jgi:hypothetical protein